MTAKTEFKWARFPVSWVRDGQGLLKLRASDSGALPALRLYVALAIYIPPSAWIKDSAEDLDQTQFFKITYKQWQSISGLDRTNISEGLKVLKSHELIEVDAQKGMTSSYRLAGTTQNGYARLPLTLTTNRMKNFGVKGLVDAYDRRPLALEALKLYLLLLSFRNGQTNRAVLSYDKINEYTGIRRARIHAAINFLSSLEMVQVESLSWETNSEVRTMNSYFIKDLANYRPVTDRSKLPQEQWISTRGVA